MMEGEGENMGEGIKVTIRMTPQDVAYLKKEVEKKRARNERSDVSDQVRISIRYRQLASLSKDDRLAVLKKLGLKKGG